MKDPRKCSALTDIGVFAFITDKAVTVLLSTDPEEPWIATDDDIMDNYGCPREVPHSIYEAKRRAKDNLPVGCKYTPPKDILSNVPEDMWEGLAPHVSDGFILAHWLPHPSHTVRALAAKYLPFDVAFARLINDPEERVLLELCKRVPVDDPLLEVFLWDGSRVHILDYLSSYRIRETYDIFLRSPVSLYRQRAVARRAAQAARLYSRDPSPQVRRQVCNQQTDLVEILKFKDDSAVEVQLTCLSMLDAQVAWEVFGSHPDPQVQIPLIEKIGPDLAQNFVSSKYSTVVRAALAKQTPEYALQFRNHIEAIVRAQIAEMQDLPTALACFANDPSELVRGIVAGKLRKGDTYRGFITDPNPHVRIAGMRVLSTQEAYMTFRFDPSEIVRTAMYRYVKCGDVV